MSIYNQHQTIYDCKITILDSDRDARELRSLKSYQLGRENDFYAREVIACL